jgi:hypothetical protein
VIELHPPIVGQEFDDYFRRHRTRQWSGKNAAELGIDN